MSRRLSFGIYHLAFIITIAVLLRLLLIPNPGFEADVSFWKSWGLAVFDKGVVEGIKVTNNNYPTPFAYVLGFMIWLYNLFADPHNFNEFWSNTNTLFLFVSKIFPILADFGIAAIILYIGRNSTRLGFPPLSRSFYLLLSVFYLFNPISLAGGAWWGQVDSLGVFVFLIAFLLALRRRPFAAGFIYMLALMTKLQNMIYGPLFFLFIWQWNSRTYSAIPGIKAAPIPGMGGLNALIQALAGATLAFFGLNIEFLLSRNMHLVLNSLTQNYDYFPWMSLNAYNLWWIVSGARGMQVSDKIAALGMVNAKTIGLLIFSSFYLFAVLRQIIANLSVIPGLTRNPPSFSNAGSRIGVRDDKQHNRLLKTFLESLIVVNAAFFLFQTQSHDRYLFPVSVFLLLWGGFVVRKKENGKRQKEDSEISKRALHLFTFYFLLFTFFYFYNLHTALIVNYPNNGLPLLSSLTQPFFTIGTAIALLFLFGVFLVAIVRSSRITYHVSRITLALGVAALVFLNKPLLTKQPVSLTRLKPYISEQTYGSRQTNRTVQSSFGGPNSWTRLSVQYAFYKEGIGTHANSRHVYDINRKFKRITFDYGIDTEAGTRASAIFEIWGDDKLLFRSDKMGRFDLPKHMEVDIKGVKFLSLVTTDAGDGNFDDHTDWLNPQLFP